MINSWICLEDNYVFAEWRFRLPFSSEKMLFKFIKDALLLALDSELLYLSNEKREYRNETMVEYYLECLKNIQNNSGYNLMFNYAEVNHRLHECFKLNYNVFVYNEDGNVVKIPTNFMGKILTDINPKEVIKKGFTEDIPPFILFSTPVNLSKKNVTEISIRLKSNIYFPRIPNILSESVRYYPNDTYINNLELASLNSDLFNSWFRSFSSLIINDYSGTSEKVSPYSFIKDYTDYISSGGVNY